MPLLAGTWKINVNGTEGDLIINANADGTISGSVIAVPLSGYWNEASQMIFFESMFPVLLIAGAIAPNSGNARGTFLGYLFNTPPAPIPGSDIKWTLCGYVMTPPNVGFSAAQSNSRRMTFGWFAQITQII